MDYIDSNHSCVAQQGYCFSNCGGEYVSARARCCLLDSSINCVARAGPRSGSAAVQQMMQHIKYNANQMNIT